MLLSFPQEIFMSNALASIVREVERSTILYFCVAKATLVSDSIVKFPCLANFNIAN